MAQKCPFAGNPALCQCLAQGNQKKRVDAMPPLWKPSLDQGEPRLPAWRMGPGFGVF